MGGPDRPFFLPTPRDAAEKLPPMTRRAALLNVVYQYLPLSE
jgi:hypothetical protein